MAKRKAMAPRRLIDDLVTEMIEYLPTGSYRFIGGVNRQFRDAHRILDLTTATTLQESSLLSFERAMIWAEENEERDSYDPMEIVTEAVCCGNVEFLTWLRDTSESETEEDILIDTNTLKTCLLNKVLCEEAANNCQRQALQWLRSQDPPCPWDEETCGCAAQNGYLDLLQWARSQDPPCPWDEDTCTSAAEFGELDVLQWARSQVPPCPWNKGTCSAAASNGHLEVLKWLRSQDPPCPWNERTCRSAAEKGRLEVLKWLRSQDPPCPWNLIRCLNEARHYPGVRHWLQSQSQT